MLDPLCAVAATVKTDLATRVHNLPPELFNQILEHTFTLDDTMAGTTTHQPLQIDTAHRVPHLMQVDTHSRARLAEQLYARPDPIYCTDHLTAASWLLSLPAAHRALLREVRVGSGLPEAAQALDSGNYLAKMQWGYIMHQLKAGGAELEDGVLHFRVSSPVEEKVEGEVMRRSRERVWSNEVS